MTQHFVGSSFTYTDPGYRIPAQNWEMANYPEYIITSTHQAVGGHNTWSNLVRLTTGYDLIIIDHANDLNRDIDKAAIEALIRRLWAADATTRIILISSPKWNGQDTGIDATVNTPTNETAIDNVATLAAYYSIPFVDYWNWCKTVVNGGTYHLNELTVDTIHPTTLGYNNMAALLEAYLPTGGAAAPSPLLARLFDNGDYENTPTVKNGTAYDSRTGTWSDGTPANSTSSSEAGATITFSATCQSFGLYRADAAANSVQVSIDGGAYVDAAPDMNGIAIAGARAAHTIAVKVKSGTVRIDQFWAV